MTKVLPNTWCSDMHFHEQRACVRDEAHQAEAMWLCQRLRDLVKVEQERLIRQIKRKPRVP